MILVASLALAAQHDVEKKYAEPAFKQAHEAAAGLASPDTGAAPLPAEPTGLLTPKPGSMADQMLSWLRENLFDPLFGQIDGSASKAARALASPNPDVGEPAEISLPSFALPGSKGARARSEPGPERQSAPPAPEKRGSGLGMIKGAEGMRQLSQPRKRLLKPKPLKRP